MKRLNLTNQRFGQLVAIEIARIRMPRQLAIWKFRCDCGNFFETQPYNVTSGHTKSCGCIQIERPSHTTHGETRHGKRSPEYMIWRAMIGRCYYSTQKCFKDYGGRGIKVCRRWRHSFRNFLSDIGRRPAAHLTIERIDNNKGYNPENCKWATYSEQQKNKRPRKMRRGM
jgi:hypothetical protein